MSGNKVANQMPSLNLSSLECSNKQLWNLIRGDSILVCEEVVHSELKIACSKIVSGLMYYPPRNANDSDVKKEISSSSNKQKTDGEDKGAYAGRDLLNDFISSKLNVNLEAAWEIFCTYMMFEYKGGKTTFEKLIETQKSSTKLISELTKFYVTERLCLLLCSQVILSAAFEEEHRFRVSSDSIREKDIFLNFISSSPVNEWCSNMTKSMKYAQSNEERIEIYHTLAMILHYFPSHAESGKLLMEFQDNFEFQFAPYRNSELLQAEAILIYNYLLSVQEPSSHGAGKIRQYLGSKYFEILSNPYSFGAIVSCFGLLFEPQDPLKAKIVEFSKSKSTIKTLCKLAATYSSENQVKRKGISFIALKVIYDCMDIILARYQKENFGEPADWYKLLAMVVSDKKVAEEFLCHQSIEMTLLYTESLSLFPIEFNGILLIWTSLCRSAISDSACATMITKLSEIGSVAELLDDNNTALVRPNGNKEWKNLHDRYLGRIHLPANAIGITAYEENSVIISWQLDTPCVGNIFWSIVNDVITEALNTVSAGDAKEIDKWMETYERQINGVAEFIIKFGDMSSKLPPFICELIKPLCFFYSLVEEGHWPTKNKKNLISLHLNLIAVIYDYSDSPTFFDYIQGLWPDPFVGSIVETTVLGNESINSNGYEVTLAFLKSFFSIFECKPPDPSKMFSTFRHVFLRSLEFIVENILPCFVRWRIVNLGDRYELAFRTLQILNYVFEMKGAHWNQIKLSYCKSILKSDGALVAILAIDELSLQDAVVRPSKEKYMLPKLIYEALRLLLKLVSLDKTCVKTVDTSLGLTLVQKLCRFAGHRLDNKLPILAFSLLKSIAADLNMSLLSCLSTESESFRDLVCQRLEFRTEDFNIKIAILEFLTVCVQTQPGLIQHIFSDKSLADKILELVNEKDENLDVAVICLSRVLFLRGGSVVYHCKELWDYIFIPISSIKSQGRLKIISATLNIFTIELYNPNDSKNADFRKKLKCFLESDKFKKVIQMILECAESCDDRNNLVDEVVKSLVALKQFLTLILNKENNMELVPKDLLEYILEEITSKYIALNETQSLHFKLKVPFAESMFQLAKFSELSYLERLTAHLAEHFQDDVISSKICLLALLNRCIEYIKEPIPATTVENTVRILRAVFSKAADIFEHGDGSKVENILAISGITVSRIISSKRCQDWDKIFHYHALPLSVVSVAHIGITKSMGPEVVTESLLVMIRMCENEKTTRMLQYAGLYRKLWVPITKLTSSTQIDSKWNIVYLLCIYLNSRLLESLKFKYLPECTAFWTCHGYNLCQMLLTLKTMFDSYAVSLPDYNFQKVKDILISSVFILHGICTLLPYMKNWREERPEELKLIFEGVFCALRTSTGLLSQPKHLQLLITSTTNAVSDEVKMTPQMEEIQTQLWNVNSMGIHVLWKLSNVMDEVVQHEYLLSNLYQIAQLCMKALTKDKKLSVNIHVTCRVSPLLEKTITLLHYHGMSAIRSTQYSKKLKQALRREIATEIGAVCDGLRRLGGSNKDFLIAICSSLEDHLK